MAKFRGAVLSCATCGAEFRVPPSRAHKAKYCSNACAGPGRGEEQEIEKVAVVCKACGKTFYEHRCHAGRRLYCSKACQHGSSAYLQGLSERSSGENNAMWKGGVSNHSEGYLYEHCPEHPFASRGYVFAHRLIAESALRTADPTSPFLIALGEQLYLRKDVVVHHKDGDRKNNDISNLQVMSNSDRIRLHNAIRRQRKEQLK